MHRMVMGMSLLAFSGQAAAQESYTWDKVGKRNEASMVGLLGWVKFFRPHKVLLTLLCLISFSAAAQGNLPWEEYDRLVERGREIAPLDTGSMFGDKIDMYTGGLSFSATDVSIPGNNSLPVAVGRKLAIYDRRDYGSTLRGPFADWTIDIPNVNGVFAPTWHDNRCEQATPPLVGNGEILPDEYWAGNMAELPGGGEMLQTDVARPTPESGGPYRWVTEGNTYFSCLSTIKNGPGQGFLAIDSNGNKYWLDHMAQYPEPRYQKFISRLMVWGEPVTRYEIAYRKKNLLYASRVEDRFGNWVTYTYSNAHDQPVRLTAITSSDGRSLTLQYDSSSGYVSSVSDGARTWIYTYTNDSLTTVTMPDDSQWNMALSALSSAVVLYWRDPNDMRSCFTPADYGPQDATGAITHPTGATATFVVGPAQLGRTNVPGICRGYQSPGTPNNDTRDDFPVWPVTWTSLVVKSKQVQGPGLLPLLWTYGMGGGWSWQYPPGQSEPICQTTTCAEPVCLSDSCAGTRSIVIQGPGGQWDSYVFGNSYRYNEGKLLNHSVGTSASDLHKVVLHTYNYATSGQPYPAKIGTSPQPRGAGFMAEYTRPLVRTETLQDGAAFVWQVEKGCVATGIYCFDSLARPLKISRSSTVSTSETGNDPVLPPAAAPVLTAPGTSSTGNYPLTWTSVATASTYQLRERLGTGTWSTIYNAGGTSATVNGNSSGSWNYEVRACNAAGCSAWSATRTTVVALPPGQVPTLTAPATNTTGSYTVSWTSAATATRYELEQQQNGGAWTNIQNAAATSRALSGQVAASYDHRVRACNAAGCTGWSAISNTVVTLPPTQVPTLTAPATNTTGSYTVSWTSAAAATRYELEQQQNGGAWSNIHNAAATSRALSGQVAASYDYRVRACNAAGCTAWSATKTTLVTLPPTQVPTLTAPASDMTGSYMVSWTAVAAATRYELEQQQNGGVWSNIHNAAATSKTLSGQAAASYGYRVRACNTAGCTAWSPNMTTVVTLPPTGVPALTVPATDTTGSYTVSWTSVAAATRYELELRIGTGAWSNIHNAAATSKAVSGQTATTHYYRVRACSTAGCAGWSAIALTAVTLPPDQPPMVTAPASSTTGSYQITWTSVAATTRYEVQQSKDGGGWALVHYGMGNYTDLGGLAAGSYAYRARACNTAGCSAYSPLATTVVSLVILGVPNLTVPSQAQRGALFMVSWTAVSGATHYVVEYSFNGMVFTGYSGTGLAFQSEHYDVGTYYYRVKACNASGCGASSASKAVKVPNGPISGLMPLDGRTRQGDNA